jgi:hypothetical protein
MDAKRKPGRPPTGHDVRGEVRMSRSLAHLVAQSVEAQGVTAAEWHRRAALHYLAAGVPRVVAEVADGDPPPAKWRAP